MMKERECERMAQKIDFQANEAVIKEFAAAYGNGIPSDDEIKAMAKKAHRPWGLLKHELVSAAVRTGRTLKSPEFMAGWKKGQEDKAAGRAYRAGEKGLFNSGYYSGYTGKTI
jgi:hypothetical protein